MTPPGTGPYASEIVLVCADAAQLKVWYSIKGPIHYHLNQNGYNVNGKVVIVLQPEPITRLDGPPPG